MLRAVLFAPEDLALVRGDPGERRRYLDELATVRRPAARRGARGLRQSAPATDGAAEDGSGARSAATAACCDTLDVWDGHLAAARRAAAWRPGWNWSTSCAPEVEKAYQLLAPASRPAADQLSRYRSSVLDDPASRTPRRLRGRAAGRAGARAATPSWNAACVWSARTATTWSCVLGEQPAKGFASHRGIVVDGVVAAAGGLRTVAFRGHRSGAAARRRVRRTGHRAPAGPGRRCRARPSRCWSRPRCPTTSRQAWDARRIAIGLPTTTTGRMSVVSMTIA